MDEDRRQTRTDAEISASFAPGAASEVRSGRAAFAPGSRKKTENRGGDEFRPSRPADAAKRAKAAEDATGEGTLRSFAAKYAPPGAYFALTAVLSAAPFTYGTYPFGLALFCAASGSKYAFAALLGVAAGSVFADGGVYVNLAALVIALARIAIGALDKSPRREADGDKKRSPLFSGQSALPAMKGSKLRSSSPGGASSTGNWTGSAADGPAKSRPKGARALSFAEDLPVRCALASAGAMVTGALGLLFHGSVWRGLAATVLSASLAPLLCAAYNGFFRPNSRRALLWCVMATAFSASWILSGVTVGSFGVGPAFALLFSFAAAHFFALPEALLFSFVLSLPLEFAVIPAILLAAGAYSLVRRQFPTLAAAAGAATALFFALGALGMTAASRYGAEFLVASAFAVPLCRTLIRLPEYLTPRSARRLRLFFGVAGEDEGARDGETSRAVGELHALSECFLALGDMAKDVTRSLALPSEAELRERVERAFALRCASCLRREECDGAGDASPYRKKLARALRNGRGTSSVAVPRALSARCAELSSILRSISTRDEGFAPTEQSGRDFSELGAILDDAAKRLGSDSEYDAGASRRLRRELSTLGVFADEVSVVSPRLRMTYIRGVEPASLHAGAEDVRAWVERSLGVEMTEPRVALTDGAIDISMHAKERFRVAMGKCSMSATASPCGDSASAFVSRDGFFRAVISDGMGSGSEAAFTAGTVTLFLERLLSAGVDISAALRITNSFLCERRIECSATVDVAQIDLVRGGASFFKSGAAPSFVLRSGNLFALRSKTVPIGILPSADAEGISFDVEEGDVIVMASDGVTRDSEDCPWLYDLFCDESITNLTAAAKRIAEEARRRSGDDITVMLLRIERA